MAFGAMAITAGIVGNACVLAVSATLDMAAEPVRPASGDGAHDAERSGTDVTGVCRTPCFTMTAEHVRHFDPRHGKGPSAKAVRPSHFETTRVTFAVMTRVLARSCGHSIPFRERVSSDTTPG